MSVGFWWRLMGPRTCVFVEVSYLVRSEPSLNKYFIYQRFHNHEKKIFLFLLWEDEHATLEKGWCRLSVLLDRNISQILTNYFSNQCRSFREISRCLPTKCNSKSFSNVGNWKYSTPKIYHVIVRKSELVKWLFYKLQGRTFWKDLQ